MKAKNFAPYIDFIDIIHNNDLCPILLRKGHSLDWSASALFLTIKKNIHIIIYYYVEETYTKEAAGAGPQ